jgi:ribosomal protein L11 methylase PrmA
LKSYPALEIRGADADRLFAAIDDLSATAVEEREDSVRVFFSTASARDFAQTILTSDFDAAPLEVSDEDWARRSQADLQPVTVGHLTISPRLSASPEPPPSLAKTGQASARQDATVTVSPEPLAPTRDRLAASPEPLAPSPDVIVITPSMGFGTGHHATTRLCLAALQTLDLSHLSVLDVGTGSGVLAIAADRLGAARALGIDHDPDAVQAARENLALNPTAQDVSFAVADLRTTPLPRAAVVTANLTGALLIETATDLLGAVDAGGTLIVSGLLAGERDEVVRALTGPPSASAAPRLRQDTKGGRYVPDPGGHDVPRARIVWECEEDGWVGLAMKKS